MGILSSNQTDEHLPQYRKQQLLEVRGQLNAKDRNWNHRLKFKWRAEGQSWITRASVVAQAHAEIERLERRHARSAERVKLSQFHIVAYCRGKCPE